MKLLDVTRADPLSRWLEALSLPRKQQTLQVQGCVLVGRPALKRASAPARLAGLAYGYVLGRLMYEGRIGPWLLP